MRHESLLKRWLLIFTPPELTPYRECVSESLLRKMSSSLVPLGIEAVSAEFSPESVDALFARERPDVVWNCCYGYQDAVTGVTEKQSALCKRLSSFGCPMVGSPPNVQMLVEDKVLCGVALSQLDVCTPETLSGGNDLAVVKPRFGSWHRDVQLINANSVAVERFPATDWIVQPYVHGPEYTVGVVSVEGEPALLTPLRIHVENEHTPYVRCDGVTSSRIVPDFEDRFALKKLAERIFVGLEMCEFARMDIRMSNGTPVVLDVNGMPNLEPSVSLLPYAAAVDGWTFSDLIAAIASSAMLRWNSAE